MMRVAMIAAAVIALLVLLRGAPIGGTDADATVELQLAAGQSVDAVRTQVSEMANSAWQGTRVSESSKGEDESTIVIAMPGTSLDGALAWLRNERNTGASDAAVELEVDASQVTAAPLASDPETSGPAPVHLQVAIVADSGSGPQAMILFAIVVGCGAVAALIFVRRRAPETDGSIDHFS